MIKIVKPLSTTQTSISATEKRLATSEIVEIQPLDSSRVISKGRLICSRCGRTSPRGLSWEQVVKWYADHYPCNGSQESLPFDKETE